MMTSEQVRARFAAEGVSLKEWARARGYKYATVYAVLNRKRSSKRGIGHRIAVELGLKAEPKKLLFRPMVDAA